MNIAEQRRSQDGQFSIQVGLKEIDIRAATMATANGERVALRILDKTLTPLSLEDIGFLPDQLNVYRKMLDSFIRRDPGWAVPPGRARRPLSTPHLTISTAMCKISLLSKTPSNTNSRIINQTQINTKAGITFASGLRTILRHDPDVVLVGESKG